MNIAGIIPARWGSTRFPGKPLADIRGKSMIRRVYEQAAKAEALNRVIVATDDDRIAGEVKSFGGEVMMTATTHHSGTERCAEVAEKLMHEGNPADVVINIQGDEPFIDPQLIELLAGMFDDQQVQIATLVRKISSRAELFNPNVVKVVAGENRRALYFSRSPIPYLRSFDENQWVGRHTYLGHIGIYAYTAKVLSEVVKLPPGRLEAAESLEQLRWLENGFNVHFQITDAESLAVDTPEDLSKFFNI